MTGRRAPMVAWCSVCGRDTAQLTADEAALFCAISSRSVYRAIEDGSIHSSENADGLLSVCFESLPNK